MHSGVKYWIRKLDIKYRQHYSKMKDIPTATESTSSKPKKKKKSVGRVSKFWNMFHAKKKHSKYSQLDSEHVNKAFDISSLENPVSQNNNLVEHCDDLSLEDPVVVQNNHLVEACDTQVAKDLVETENYINEYLASSDHPLTPEQVWRNTSDNTSDHYDTINTENHTTSGTLSPANRPAEGVQDPRNGNNQQNSGNVNNSSSATEASVLPEGTDIVWHVVLGLFVVWSLYSWVLAACCLGIFLLVTTTRSAVAATKSLLELISLVVFALVALPIMAATKVTEALSRSHRFRIVLENDLEKTLENGVKLLLFPIALPIMIIVHICKHSRWNKPHHIDNRPMQENRPNRDCNMLRLFFDILLTKPARHASTYRGNIRDNKPGRGCNICRWLFSPKGAIHRSAPPPTYRRLPVPTYISRDPSRAFSVGGNRRFNMNKSSGSINFNFRSGGHPGRGCNICRRLKLF